MEKKEWSNIVEVNVNWYNQYGEQYGFFLKKKKKTKNKATIWSSNPTPGYISGENMVHKYTCTPVFIAVLFTIANTEKQLSVHK